MMRQIILTGVPLPFFKAMAQSRRGVVQVMEVIWRIMPPTKIITGSRITHLSKTQKINAHNLNLR
jgi:hypothetical protein